MPALSALIFLQPYPLFIACDGDSGVRLVPTRPFRDDASERRAALRFENGKAAIIGGDFRRGAAARCVATHVDLEGGAEIAPGTKAARVLVYTGDSQGNVQAFDVTRALNELDVRALKATRWARAGYNPRRRLRRDHALSASSDKSPPPPASAVYAEVEGVSEWTAVRWTAHDAARRPRGGTSHLRRCVDGRLSCRPRESRRPRQSSPQDPTRRREAGPCEPRSSPKDPTRREAAPRESRSSPRDPTRRGAGAP